MAKNFAKWIAGTLGWALGGPIGGIFGFALGAMFDNTFTTGPDQVPNDGGQSYRHRTSHNDFIKALLVLASAVMKADGKVEKSELDYVRDFFNRQFGTSHTADYMLVMQEIIKQNIPVREVCEQVRYNMEHPSRLQLLHFLFGISLADGHVHDAEIQLIRQISSYLDISGKDFESIKAMFWKDKDAAYKILEIEKFATDEEVKKAYRKMALKYHPDKISHLGDEFKKSADDKFLKVQEAYELIKKERGLK